MSGYLFAHFTGEKKDEEQVYFSFSKDGLFWKDLNGGKPVLRSELGEKGARDPFLVKDPEREVYYLIATDLRIEAGKGWKIAQEEGSRNLLVWESEDLVHWSEERICEVGIPEAGCVWAPEAVFDEDKKEFLVFWASKVKKETDEKGKHRIYASYTKDFKEFSKPFLFLERPQDVIDTTIIYDNGIYYRFSKDETTSRLILECSEKLTGNYDEISSEFLKELEGVEGPECYRLPDGTWCLIADRFKAGKGYLPILCNSLENGEFTIVKEDDFDFGITQKRHGGVLSLTEEEAERVWRELGEDNPVLDGLYADPDLVKFGDTFYLYPTTDGFTNWTGTEFYVFSSKDGMHFKKEKLILDISSDDVPWAVGCAWAPCIAKKGDKYYFYFCGKREDGKSCIGVAVADCPTGPFLAQSKPLVTPEMLEEFPLKPAQVIDPSIYQEGEESYLVFGNCEPYIVKLGDDMLHIEPDTMSRLDGAFDFRESMIILKKDDIYHFTWSCDDTGSENYHVNYGTSDSLTGPIHFEYPILEKNGESLGTGHHSILKLSGNNEYRIAYHRFATPLKKYKEGKGFHREVCIAELRFGKDGKIEPVCVQ